LKRAVLINVLAFQLGWFAVVLGAAHSAALPGCAIAWAIILVHVARAPRPRVEATLIALAALAGALFDSTLAALGIVEYAAGTPFTRAAPYWIVTLWMLFACTLNVSIAWLKYRLPTASAIGAAAGPLAYLGGEKLDALAFPDREIALITLALGWALITPALLIAARRFNGFPRSPTAPSMRSETSRA